MILAHTGAYLGYTVYVHVTFIRLYRSCYIEMRYMGAYPGVGACLGHYEMCVPHVDVASYMYMYMYRKHASLCLRFSHCGLAGA